MAVTPAGSKGGFAPRPGRGPGLPPRIFLPERRGKMSAGLKAQLKARAPEGGVVATGGCAPGGDSDAPGGRGAFGGGGVDGEMGWVGEPSKRLRWLRLRKARLNWHEILNDTDHR